MSATILHLQVKPNGRTNQLVVGAAGELTVRVQAPPHAGQANTALVAYLAQVFGLRKSSVTIVAGHTAPFKKLRLDGVDSAECKCVLEHYRAP